MRILLISPASSGLGGTAGHVQGLRRFLEAAGHGVEIMSSENTPTIPVRGLKNPSFMLSSAIMSGFKRGFDIVHAHNVPSAPAMKRVPGKKVLTIHGIYSEQMGRLHGRPAQRLSGALESGSLSWADAVTAVSREARDHYAALGFDVERIPNAIDPPEPDPDRRHEKQVVFAGRLSREKGTEALARVARGLPAGVHLLIAGAGPEEGRLRREAAGDNVHVLGLLGHREAVNLIAGSDVLLQPSLSEGTSTTILEAMACGTCVLASNAGGNPELIEDGASGALVDPADHDAVLEGLLQLIDDPARRRRMSDAARARAKEFTWDAVGGQYLGLYGRLLRD